MYDPYRRRREKAAAIRERRMGAVDFTLPVDGDAPAWRSPTVLAGDRMEALVADLVRDRSPFYDEVCARWSEMFPELKARPARWVSGEGGSGKMFLSVGSSAGLFALRPKLPAIRKRLSALASAPKRFTVHLEIAVRRPSPAASTTFR